MKNIDFDKYKKNLQGFINEREEKEKQFFQVMTDMLSSNPLILPLSVSVRQATRFMVSNDIDFKVTFLLRKEEKLIRGRKYFHQNRDARLGAARARYNRNQKDKK